MGYKINVSMGGSEEVQEFCFERGIDWRRGNIKEVREGVEYLYVGEYLGKYYDYDDFVRAAEYEATPEEFMERELEDEARWD